MFYKVKQGDIIWLDFDPQMGREQKGRRPAIVISNNAFNEFTKSLAMLCPITNTDRNFPMHIRLDDRTVTNGVIMCDQAKVFDIQRRNASFIEAAPMEIVIEVTEMIKKIIEIEDDVDSAE
ncbi:MAG: type II toxin-antitoxin system PemK/MazF family toxin [Oscillospiraceae bacterium]|nr:type II toxin-antitoxin system PemK/MazF family toxin [Oscillospiraceae bacterium]